MSIQELFDKLGLDKPLTDLSGNSGRITTMSGKKYFLKTGEPSSAYRCEANGLKELSMAGTIRIVNVVSAGDNYILTEFIEQTRPSEDFYNIFGSQLAAMHRFHSPEFGFFEDNYIGSTPQMNIPEGDEKVNWISFYFHKRLLFQYLLAEQKGYITSILKTGFKKFEKNIHSLLQDSLEPPTLLHGDLWSGNFLCDAEGKAVLIDPAVYYGHREADLAMTKVFGGFPPEFYNAYMKEYPLQPGWEKREGIYKLYHLLNHVNLFGRSYLSETERLFSDLEY